MINLHGVCYIDEKLAQQELRLDVKLANQTNRIILSLGSIVVGTAVAFGAFFKFFPPTLPTPAPAAIKATDVIETFPAAYKPLPLRSGRKETKTMYKISFNQV